MLRSMTKWPNSTILKRYTFVKAGLWFALTKKHRSKKMKTNEGKVDRIFRIILGLGLLSLVFIGPQTLWGLVGLVQLLTGLMGFCPLYRVFGFATCPLK